MQITIHPAAYKPLLSIIAKGESNGSYNAYFGNAANTTLRFTDMSVGEVIEWQKRYVAQGSPSSAVGRYQIIRSTLEGLVRQLHIQPNARFDPKLQDRLARALIDRRGAYDFVQKKLSKEQFAANLAKEWAALPRLQGANPEQSYYHGDGLNASRVSVQDVLSAIEMLAK